MVWGMPGSAAHAGVCSAVLPLDQIAARIGRMFGLPAGYAGRKLFVCLMEDGLIVKLPDHVARDEVRTGKAVTSPGRAGRAGGVWVTYKPRTAREASRLAPILEVAARYVVQTA